MILTHLMQNIYRQNPFDTKVKRSIPNRSFLSISRVDLWKFLSLFRLWLAVVAKQSHLICSNLRSISRRKRRTSQTKSLIRLTHPLKKLTKSSKHTLRNCTGTREILAKPLLENASASTARIATTANPSAGESIQHAKENDPKRSGHASSDLKVQSSNASDTDQSHDIAQFKTN